MNEIEIYIRGLQKRGFKNNNFCNIFYFFPLCMADGDTHGTKNDEI